MFSTSVDVGQYARFWSSSIDTSTTAWFRHLSYSIIEVSRLAQSRAYGFSVRCLRDTTTSEDSDADGTIYTDAYTGNDGTKYDAVKIGSQVWINENLKETKYADGTTITLATQESEWSDTEGRRGTASNYTADVNTYGYLYNWFAVDNGLVNPGDENTTNFFQFF
jgi:hypothetical protein